MNANSISIMPTRRTCTPRNCKRIFSLAAVLLLSACDGTTEQTEVIDDPTTSFDFAELLFTETDRLWRCSVVSNGDTTTGEEVYFSRSGTASFSSVGAVFWNRDPALEIINVAAPGMANRFISGIQSSNSTLQFMLMLGSVESNYDCVLAPRDPLDSVV